MARIIFPENLGEQRKLLADISTKHTADGAASVLTPFLTEQGIVLADDTAAGALAQTHESNRSAQSRNAENLREQRDLLFDFPVQVMQKCAQFLKGLYKPNVHALDVWGFTVNVQRISYPAEFLALHDLFQVFYAKHAGFAPGASPLEPFLTEHGIVLADLLVSVNQAKVHHDNFITASNAAELAREQRDFVWRDSNSNLHKMGDYLKKLFVTSPRKLGNYGFVVDDSPRGAKEQISTVLISGQLTVKGVVLGSTFENIGDITLHLYKGKTTTGTPIIVSIKDKVGMAKGFSVITVMNPSSSINGKFKVLVHK